MTTLEDFIKDSVSKQRALPIPLSEPVNVAELHTPALIIDLDIFETNLENMVSYLQANQLGLRSHTKMHKCPIIAAKQIEGGAIGICSATVSEAEVMHAYGIDNILITSPVVTQEKIMRVVALACVCPGLQIVVDHVQGADHLNEAAHRSGISLQVLIDLDPGMGRTGVELGDAALNLGNHIGSQCRHLSFGGLQMYAGNCMHIHGFRERRDKYLSIMAAGFEMRDLFESSGIDVEVFTGGGTGTFDIEPELGLITDIQAGSYAFMDVEYREIGGRGERALFDDFEPSLHVLVTAISQPQKRLITVDAGYKAFASDTVKPEFQDIEGVKFQWGGDEHGIVQLNNPSRTINLGDKLPMVVSHCDPTVNLYDYYFPHRDGIVTEIWPVAARGRSQ